MRLTEVKEGRLLRQHSHSVRRSPQTEKRIAPAVMHPSRR